MKPLCLSLRALAAVTTLLILYSPTAHAANNAAKIAGDLTLTKDSNGNNTGIHFSDGTSQFTGNPWGTANSTSPDIGFVQGKVGIGTLTPATALDVTGDINLSGNLLLPQTTSASSGIIKQNNETFIHSNGLNSFFAGRSAGNLSASGGNNTGIGAFTLNALDNIGFKNTAVGSKALDANTSGSNNVAIGTSAGGTGGEHANVTGSGNTFIGAYSGPGTATVLNNATAIGLAATVSQSNSMVLGGIGVYAVKVGIGTVAPSATLTVQGIASQTDNLQEWKNNSGTVLTSVDKNGRIGIGTATPGATLDALRLIRVFGSTLTAGDWPTSGIGLELAHDSVANKGYIVSYKRTAPAAWGSLDIQASTVTIGGTPGDLTVTGSLNAGNIASGTWSGSAISAAKGGTGLDSSGAVAGSIFKTTSTGTWDTLVPGSEGQILKMSGGSPVWSSSSTDATSLFRVLGTASAPPWPTSGAGAGAGLELAHISTTNTGYIQSYNRVGSQWGPLEINASTVTVGGSGSPGNLAVSGNVAVTGVVSGNGSGLTNITPIKSFGGAVPLNIAGTDGAGTYVFAGPTVAITTTATQHLVGSAVAVLGTSDATLFEFDFGLCYRLNGTPDGLINFAGSSYTTASTSLAMGKKTFGAASSATPGVGTWEVGYCVRNDSTSSLDFNDFVNGWIMTTN